MSIDWVEGVCFSCFVFCSANETAHRQVCCPSVHAALLTNGDQACRQRVTSIVARHAPDKVGGLEALFAKNHGQARL